MAFQGNSNVLLSDIVDTVQFSEDVSTESGPMIVCTWSLADSNQDSIFKNIQKEWDAELDNTPVQDDAKPPQEEELAGAMGNNPVQDGSTSPTEYKDRGASSGLLRSKRPMSTPIRHSFDPVRIHKLRRSFKTRATWIQNDSEFIPDATPDDLDKDSVSDVKEEDINDEVVGRKRKDLVSEEDIDDEMVGRKRKNLGSTIRRKRKRILRGAIRYYARYADSDSE